MGISLRAPSTVVNAVVWFDWYSTNFSFSVTDYRPTTYFEDVKTNGSPKIFLEYLLSDMWQKIPIMPINISQQNPKTNLLTN